LPNFTNELTDFVGANEDPLSDGGNWGQASTARPPLKRQSNSATDSDHGEPNYSYYTTPLPDGKPQGIYACSTGGQLGVAVETWRIALYNSVGASISGYHFMYGGGIGKGYFLWAVHGSASFSTIDTSSGPYPQKMGIIVNGSSIEGWSYNSGIWTLRCSAIDGAYSGPMYPVLGIEDPTGGGLGFVCFGLLKTFVPQIYRRTNE